MPPPLPRCSGWAYSSLISPSRVSLPRKGRRVGLHIDIFEACSAFTRVAACTLALSPIRDTLIEGFSHFVTSMTAPIASGWSESPGGACTHWKAPPCHSPTSYLIFRNINILRHNIQILANIAGRRASRRRHRGCKRCRGRSGAPIKKPGLSTGAPLHTMVPLAQRKGEKLGDALQQDIEKHRRRHQPRKDPQTFGEALA